MISTATNSVRATVTTGTGPDGVAFTPHQAPVASFTVTAAAAGSPTSFNSSASTTAYGTITNYAWNFGDGDNANTSTATTTHTYASWGNYTATVTLTDSAGTSTTQVFTGQTVSDNGGTGAEASQSFTVPSVLGWVTTPGNISFSDTLSGDDQTATATLPLDVGDGNLTAGWSLSATSTTFSTSGGTHVLSTAATTVQSAPTGSCDSTCTLATNAITYPYTLPGGSTAPTATNLYVAAASTGVGNQTVTPTFTLSVPANTYAGSYSSTLTVTLSSGP